MSFLNPALLVAVLMLATGSAAVADIADQAKSADAAQMQARRDKAGEASFAGAATLVLARG